MPVWTDSHCHLQEALLGDSERLIEAMKSVGITTAVVNATGEADWATVEDLAKRYQGLVLPAYGIHPWQAHTASPGWQERLRCLLEKYPHASVGECGLDLWVDEPSLEIQRGVFRDQLELASALARPVTIHCLKAWAALFEVFAESPPPPRFLMHSYGGSIEIARRLIPLGAYFSVSGHFLHPRKAAVLEVFRQLPRDRILLETDAPSMLPPAEFLRYPGPCNHPANLPAIGEALASALGMSAEDLAAMTRENSQRFLA